MEDRRAPEIDLESEFDRFVRQGDVEALARVFDATAPALLSVARHLARGTSDAEDLVQATFLTAIERASTFDRSRNLLAWLTGILALHARKHLRQAARALDPERMTNRDTEDPHRAAQGAEVSAAVERAMGELPERYASVLRMHLRDQLAPREIALRLGIDPGTARVQLHRGLRMLRETLPAGLGGFGAATLPSSGLSAVREAVLVRGAQYTVTPSGAVAVVSTGISGSLVVIAALVLALVGGLALHTGRGAVHTEDTPMLTALTLPASAPPAPGLADPSSPAVAASPGAPSRAQVPPVPAPATSLGDAARVSGRLLLPDGKPAVDAQVKLRGWNANQERVIESPPPADWKDPAPVRTDADGRFAIDVVPPRAFQFSADAELAGHARLSWRWTGIATRERVDVGERKFQPSCTVRVRVLDKTGAPMATRFQVSARQGRSGFSDGSPADVIEPIIVDARFEDASGEYVLEGVPPGRTEVKAKSDVTDWLQPRNVVTAPGEPVRTDFIYEGPDPSTRIVVTWSCRPFHTFDPDLAHVRLLKDGGSPIAPKKLARTPDSVSFDGLGEGPYTVEIDDPRFERFVQPGVEPGTRVRAKLLGSAAIAVVLKRGEERVEVEPERLTLTYPESGSSPNEFDLRAPPRLPVVEGFLTGIVPGRCELRVGVKGYPETRVPVGLLQPGERRRMVVDLGSTRTLRGVVLDAEGGKPSKGAVVLLTRGPRSGHGLGKGATLSTDGRSIPVADFRVTTGADGRFAFAGLQADEYTVRAAWGEWLFVDRTIMIGEEDPPELALIAPESGALEVEMLAPEGANVDGLGLELQSATAPRERAFLQFRMDEIVIVPGSAVTISPIRPGRYSLYVTVSTPDMSSGGYARQEVEVVAAKRTPVVIDMRESLPARLRVRATIEGRFQPGQPFEVVRADGGELGPHMLAFQTDAGTSLGILPPGRFHLQFFGADERWSWSDPRVIELRAGQDLEVEAEIPIIQRTLVLLDASGKALADRDVFLIASDSEADAKSSGRSDALGRAHLAKLPGRYRVRVDGLQSQPLEWDKHVPESLEVRLAPR